MTEQFGPHGLLHKLNKQFAIRVAICEFDTAAEDADGVSNKTVAAHKQAVTFPIGAIILGGFIDVKTQFTGEAGATVAVSVQGANDIAAVETLANLGWNTTGRKAIVPKFNTPESTSVVVAASAKTVTFTVGVDALTAGRLFLYLFYLELT